MADDARIEDLRRRIRKDPASIAFGPLAEELRRAGRCREAVIVCRTGLASHPDYLSARVTLGRALLALDHLDDAERELEHVHSTAPENLVATRALVEITARRAATPARSTEPAVGPATPGEAPTLTARGATPSAFERRCIPAGCVAPPSNIPDIIGRCALPAGRLAVLGATMELHHGLLTTEITETTESGIFSVSSVGTVVDTTAPQKSTADPVESLRMARTLAALESWLAALHVTRAERRA